MRFRTGLIVGLAVGYYYGAKAGHDRFYQLDELVARVRDTAAYQAASERLGSGLRDGTTAAKRMIDETAFGGRAEADPRIFEQGDPTEPFTLRSIFTDPTLN